MGIYVFKHILTNWIKVGYTSEINPYTRLKICGFNDLVCPDELKNKLYYNQLELLHWFPYLNNKIERHFHVLYKDKGIGEFYEINYLNNILIFLREIGYESNNILFDNWVRELCFEINIKNTNLKNDIKNKSGMVWDKNETSKLSILVDNNIPIREISRILKRTKRAIWFKINC